MQIHQRDKLSFPCIPLFSQFIQPIDYKQLFRWGCDQLADQTTKCPESRRIKCINIPQNTWFNIYMAMKYGIWSLPGTTYRFEYNNFEQDRNKNCKFCFIFIHQKYLYGIAEVIQFLPEKTFMYWYSNQNNSLFGGTIKIKFSKIGRSQLDNNTFQQLKSSNKQTIQSAFDYGWNNLNENDLNLDKMRQFDRQQKIMRLKIFNNPQLVDHFKYQHNIWVNKFHQKYQQFKIFKGKNESRRNHVNTQNNQAKKYILKQQKHQNNHKNLQHKYKLKEYDTNNKQQKQQQKIMEVNISPIT